MKATLLVTTVALLVCITLAQAQTIDFEGNGFTQFDFETKQVIHAMKAHKKCSLQTSCKNCSDIDACFWCDSEDKCVNWDTLEKNNTCHSGWCQGDGCECDRCIQEIFPCSNNIVGIIILLAFYGVLLAFGAKFISDGSELLLEILDPGLIGGLLIPILGAVPDAAIVVVSGAVGTAKEAQKKLAVGVGTLAGSTVMLLTIPWAFSLLLARTDIRNGESVDNVRTKKFDIKNQGTTVDKDTGTGALIMLITVVSYLIGQGVAFAYLHDPSGGSAHKIERWFALVGFIACGFAFAAYCAYQVLNPKLQNKKIEAARETARIKIALTAFQDRLKPFQDIEEGETSDEDSAPLQPEAVRTFGLKWKAKAEAEADAEVAVGHGGIQAEEEEEEEVNPKKIALEAIFWLVLGTVIVSFFSDPMVTVITDFGAKISIGPFFVSFVITPFCSNASELISSLIFASKRRKTNSSLTYSAIYGACTMNNTMVLGIFYALIFFRKLAWTFTAEVMCILFATLPLGIIGMYVKTIRMYWFIPVIIIYPASIFLVWFLEYVAGLT